MIWKSALFVIGLMLAAVPALAQTPGQMASDADLMRVHHELEAVIQELSRDKHDYGGHKGKAEALLNDARRELIEAENFAREHGH